MGAEQSVGGFSLFRAPTYILSFKIHISLFPCLFSNEGGNCPGIKVSMCSFRALCCNSKDRPWVAPCTCFQKKKTSSFCWNQIAILTGLSCHYWMSGYHFGLAEQDLLCYRELQNNKHNFDYCWIHTERILKPILLPFPNLQTYSVLILTCLSSKAVGEDMWILPPSNYHYKTPVN